MKIYDDDRIVPYKNTKITALSTKAEIDGLLAKWGIRDSAWRWDIANNEVFVMFQLEEEVSGRKIKVPVKIEPPRIWTKGNRKRREAINWSCSMRVLFWYLKSHLEASYLSQSSKITEMLPYIQVPTEKGSISFKDVILPEIEHFKALPYLPRKTVEVVDVEETDEK